MRKLWKGMGTSPNLWENVYNAYRAGYDACGAMLLPRGGSIPEIVERPELWDRVQKAMDETGAFLDGIGNCIIDDPGNPHPFGMGVAPDPETLRPVFEFAGKHGISGVQTSIWTENEDMALEKFAKLCDVTADYGINVTLEFVAWAVCDDIKKAQKILKEVNRPNARITVDVMHLYYKGASVEDVQNCPPELIDCFHICDVPHIDFPKDKAALAKEGRSYRLFPGESGADFADLVRAIPEGASIMPEIPHKERTEAWGAFEYSVRSLEACKKYYRDNNIPL